jgi:hypothetical protein
MGSRPRKEVMRRVRESRYIVQPSSAKWFGRSTMAHPELWSGHVAEFMRWLGDEAFRG